MAHPPSPRRALITGGSSGIGATLGRRIASRGVEVWLAARRMDALNAQVERIRAAGGKARAVALDIAEADATYEALGKLDDEVGGFDLVVANAGLGGLRASKGLAQTPWVDVRDVLDINLVGNAATIMPFIPRMLARGHGHLVGISSIAADGPTVRGAAYNASKIGLSMFLESADIELRPKGIAVTIVHPGFVTTPMSAQLPDRLPFLMTDEAAARIIDRGIQRRAHMIRFPWILGAAARGANWLPRFIRDPLLRRAMAEPPKLPP